MAEIRAFQGLCYNPAKIEQISDVIAPPYDVISPEQKEQLLQRSPYNIVRLILPDGEEPYRNANRIVQSWMQQQVLLPDAAPSIYCYHQTFKTPEGEERTRKGFLALIRLVDWDQGVVLPHEATLSAPKEDRLMLLRACKINFSPIFSLYSDPELKADKLLEPFTSTPPRTKAQDPDGILNTFWAISDRDTVEKVQSIMSEHWVLIADGHHRYESCLLYRNERSREDKNPDAPFHFTLMFFCNINQPGITVLPYNRAVLSLPTFDPEAILRKASGYFSIQSFGDSRIAFAELKVAGRERTAFLARFAGTPGWKLFSLMPGTKLESYYAPETPRTVQNLDVNVLHKIFLGAILSISDEDIRNQTYLKYYKNAEEEQKDFERGKLQIAFFLNPTRVDQVIEVSKAGKKMPQKSTFFYPKLMTGFVMNKHE
ncbi:DUF1015 domain-containing protein [bacterium]|nr:DUF1015 domain-containing protein [bacterium]MCI0604147.1 DUF1015 domain-containing protein [bacterium]